MSRVGCRRHRRRQDQRAVPGEHGDLPGSGRPVSRRPGPGAGGRGGRTVRGPRFRHRAEQALERDDVEIVVNLTIPAAHAEVASAALAAGKHVWNEKPITVDRESAVAVLRQADSAGLIVGCAPDTFLGPGQQTARRMIDRGDIGRAADRLGGLPDPRPAPVAPQPGVPLPAGRRSADGHGPVLPDRPESGVRPADRCRRSWAPAPDRPGPSGRARGPARSSMSRSRPTSRRSTTSGPAASRQATFSFDSPLARVGVLEIAGTEATLAHLRPEPVHRRHPDHQGRRRRLADVPATGVGVGRGIGVVDMARALRGGGSHRATGELALHVLDAMLATTRIGRAPRVCRHRLRFRADSAAPRGLGPHEARGVKPTRCASTLTSAAGAGRVSL